MTSLKTIIKGSKFKNFDEFWPYYINEHANPLNKRFHFACTLIVHFILFYVFATADFKVLWFVPLVGYVFACLGNFIFEKNRTTSFRHPLWSLRGDFKMFYLTLFKKL